jgi:hypothetical protein
MNCVSLLGFRCRIAACLALSIVSGVTGRAEPGKVAPLMTVPGEPLAHDSFADSLPKPWAAGRGTWTVENGVVRGLEVAADKHVAVMRRPLVFTNAILTFSFRLGQARQISLSINDAKGHLCRLIVDPRSFTVRKDDHDHGGPDKALVFARVPRTIAPGEWHTAVVELNGSEMVAQIDGAPAVGLGAHPMLDRPKSNFGFTVTGGPAEFRDISIVAATPRADWPETKSRLTAKK